MSRTSDCCDAPIWSGGMCSFCKEHCEPMPDDEQEESELAPINEAIATLSPVKPTMNPTQNTATTGHSLRLPLRVKETREGPTLFDREDGRIAECYFEGDAREIVLACNNHAELVAALEMWVEWSVNRKIPFEIISASRAALALAKGTP
jgi:hypothetical protein